MPCATKVRMLGELRLELGLEERRLLDAEAPVAAVGVGEGEDERRRGGERGALQRRQRELGLERRDVHLQRAEVARQRRVPGLAACRQRLDACRREVAEDANVRGRAGRGGSAEDERNGERERGEQASHGWWCSAAKA